MTSITNTLSEYSHTLNLDVCRKKIQNFASQFVTLRVYPNEYRIISILRKAFEAIAGIFISVSMMLGGIPLSVGLMVHEALQPSSHYIIGLASKTLTTEEINSSLQLLTKAQRKFSCIEIRSAAVMSHNEETAKLLKLLHPSVLILPILNCASFVDSIESFTHYYKRKIDPQPAGKSICKFELKEKIKHIVLSSDPNEMVEALKKLTDKEERVFKIFYTSLVPRRFQNQVKDLVARLRPSVEALIDNKEKHSLQALEAMMYA